MTDKEFLKETRLLGAIKFFNNLYKSTLEKLNLNIHNSCKKASIEFSISNYYMIMVNVCIYMLFINV